MKFRFKKGSINLDCHGVEERINEFVKRRVSKGFYSKKKGHYTDNLHQEFVVEVIIRGKK